MIVPATLVGAGEAFGQTARRFDLVVGPAASGYRLGGGVAHRSGAVRFGRPVVVVPYIHKGPAKLDNMALCWDGSRTAARAMNDALPLMRRAKSIDIVMVRHATDRGEIEGADIAATSCTARLADHAHRSAAGRRRRRKHDFVLPHRSRYRPDGDGRLQPFAPARAGVWRDDAHGARLHDDADLDVALSRGAIPASSGTRRGRAPDLGRTGTRA